jgi:plastocyanin domain-containing protein
MKLKAFATALLLLPLAATTGMAEPKTKTVTMTVTSKGFEPAAVEVKKGEAVTLVITRKTEKTCATDIVIDEVGVKQTLPLNTPVKVTFTPTRSGELKYGCAMDKMVGGVLKVQ